MALNREKLVKTASNPSGPSRWSYKTTDTHAQVDAAGYFNDAGDLLKLGDIIDVTVVTNIDASNEAVSTFGYHVVNSKSGPSSGAFTVDVANASPTAGTLVDSD